MPVFTLPSYTGQILNNYDSHYQHVSGTHFQKGVLIIDCSEIYTEKPSSLKSRVETYSNYKSQIGITPQGTISFISKGWGGRSRDKLVTEQSHFLSNSIGR